DVARGLGEGSVGPGRTRAAALAESLEPLLGADAAAVVGGARAVGKDFALARGPAARPVFVVGHYSRSYGNAHGAPIETIVHSVRAGLWQRRKKMPQSGIQCRSGVYEGLFKDPTWS